VGFHERAPLLRFEGRLDRGSDLRGEKLNATFAENVVRAALEEHAASFAMLAPELSDPPRYVVYFEECSEPDRLASAIEQRLCEAMHYRYARELGQLGPVAPRLVNGGEQRVLRELVRRGQRLGDIKPTGFDPRPIWSEVFR
jgi:hypothetical protein